MEDGTGTATDTGVVVDGGVAKVPITTASATPADPGADVASIVPDAYKDKPWVKEIKTADQLFKRLDDNITALSKRPAGIPQENASLEDWQQFYKATGVPEKPEEYDFTIEGTEYTELDKSFHDALRPVLQQAGISKRQLAALAPGFNEAIAKLASDAGEQSKLKDQNFDELMASTFGDRRDEVIEGGKKLLTAYAPDGLKNHLQELDNKSLVVLAGVLDKINTEFVKEGSLPPRSGSGVGGVSEADRQKRRQEIMASEAYRNEFHPGHNQARRELEELYGTYVGEKS